MGGRVERVLRRVGAVRPIRTVLLSRIVALPGYWLASAVGLVWGAPLSRFRVRRRGGILVCEGMPNWSYARGGTMVGAAFWTGPSPSEAVVRHEAVHKEQWKRYGWTYPALYLAAGSNALTNRFEVEAGLEDGGYVRGGHRPAR